MRAFLIRLLSDSLAATLATLPPMPARRSLGEGGSLIPQLH